MTANELRQKYLNFFKTKGHAIIPSASLIPENDPTALFISAGMHPLVPYLVGSPHPVGKRLADVQKCIRTTDIDEVGDTTHHTFFEMLGNWSLGDYFKKDAIEWSWEFLTSPQWLALDKKRLAVSVFAGDQDAPFDQEAYDMWKNIIGLPEKMIAKLPKKDNWWGPAGETGPCGPDTEMFYFTGKSEEVPDYFDPEDKRWVEIWNDVFMQYNKNSDGSYELLEQKNVDTGMGLERTLAVLNELNDDYKTELFQNIIKKIEKLSQREYRNESKAMRIIADHLKAVVFIMGDNKGVSPSNTDQGYIVRRLIRRAIRYGRQIGIYSHAWAAEIAESVISDFRDNYPELNKNSNYIISELNKEEKKFARTLEKGEKMIKGKTIDGETAFNLFQTYGYPVEMTKEIAAEKGIMLTANFDAEYEKAKIGHQELSRTASAGKFKGGLADADTETRKLHTAAHLLLAALRKVLGGHVIQKGSNITAERLRFDFSHPVKLTDGQKSEIEASVNEAIRKDLPVTCDEMSLNEARDKGAMGIFESKYGEKVKVYTVGNIGKIISKEICGGPHASRTGELGVFKIQKEESSSSGVRRIKAILG